MSIKESTVEEEKEMCLNTTTQRRSLDEIGFMKEMYEELSQLKIENIEDNNDLMEEFNYKLKLRDLSLCESSCFKDLYRIFNPLRYTKLRFK